MQGTNGKRRKINAFVLILSILTILLLLMQIVIADCEVDLKFLIRTENGPPIIHDNEFPTNKSEDIMLATPCRIQVSDPDYDSLNIYWYEKSTGEWVLRQTDSLVEGGKYYWTYVQALEKSTKYYWKVVVNDGYYSVSATYYFTTLSDSSPTPPPVEQEPTNQPPIANITGPTRGYEHESLMFYSNKSYDPDGEIIAYRWYLEDEDGKSNITVRGESEPVSCCYSLPGNYTIMLEVIDDDGAISIASHNISIIQLTPLLNLPIPSINASYGHYTNKTVNFSGEGSYDLDGNIANYTWNFGDGTTAYTKNVSHVYEQSGNYTVILTVKDNDNLTNLTTMQVTISDQEAEEPEERVLPFAFPVAIVVAIAVAIILLLIKSRRTFLTYLLLKGKVVLLSLQLAIRRTILFKLKPRISKGAKRRKTQVKTKRRKKPSKTKKKKTKR